MSKARKGSFETTVAKFATDALARHENLRRAVVVKLFSAVIMDTPVDTGRLRGNWRTSTGAIDSTVTEEKDPSGAKAIADVQKNLGNGTNKDVKVYLANSLPYAVVIEYEGHSKTKAPEGMVRKNVLRFQQMVNERLKSNGSI